MKLNPEKLIWLLVLLPALPFVVNAYLDKAAAFINTADGASSEYNWLQKTRLDFAPVLNRQYLTECGSCHFAFQPGLLPQRSWEKIMAGLDDHFGDNAELDPQINQTISAYLAANSAEHSDYLRSQHLNTSIKITQIPVRITDTLYFKRKHNQIAGRLVNDNPQTSRFSNCNTCHRHAGQGLYNEHDILIPDKILISSTLP